MILDYIKEQNKWDVYKTLIVCLELVYNFSIVYKQSVYLLYKICVIILFCISKK